MPIGSSAIACQSRNTRHRTRLCLHIFLGEGVLHSSFERAVSTSNGERRQQVAVDGGIAISITQQAHLQLWRHIII